MIEITKQVGEEHHLLPQVALNDQNLTYKLQWQCHMLAYTLLLQHSETQHY